MCSSPSVSGNVSLYPSLALQGDLIGCAWYEHGSPEKPERSDVWFSMSHDANHWSIPVNVSRGISYNNGPSLTCHPNGGFVCAWHSWRHPGLEPFCADGDVCNVWTSHILNDGSVSEAHLALPGWSRTEYPSLATWGDTLVLVCTERGGGRLLVSFSADGAAWSEPLICRLPEDGNRLQWPSVVISADGVCYITAVSGHNNTVYVFNVDEREMRTVGKFNPPEPAIQHPKIMSGDEDTHLFSAYSSNWGSFTDCFDIEVDQSPLLIELSPQGGAGRAHWTLNYIDIISHQGDITKYNFGPGQLVSGDVDVVNVSSLCLDPAKAQAGFSKPVDELLRELGTLWTRGLVHSGNVTSLFINIPHGRYTMKVVHSSWMASQPCTQIQVKNAKVVHHDGAEVTADHCYIYTVDVNTLMPGKAKRISPLNSNRPSQILTLPHDHKHLIAWVDWSGDATSIMVKSMAKRM